MVVVVVVVVVVMGGEGTVYYQNVCIIAMHAGFEG